MQLDLLDNLFAVLCVSEDSFFFMLSKSVAAVSEEQRGDGLWREGVW